MSLNINSFTPGKKLYLDVRVGFVAAETTLNAWCNENGINPANARQCLVGSWDGPKAKKLRARIVEAAGVATRNGGASEEQALQQGVA